MRIAVDTSVIIAVIADEPQRIKIIELTKNSTIVAPSSVKWEVGNAFSAMMKKSRINLQQAISAIGIYEEISIEIIDVSISKSMELASKYNMYAYDAYILQCAIQENVPLLTLDKELADIAQKEGVQILEV
jgi:predicted nucleic acid-binding protein